MNSHLIILGAGPSLGVEQHFGVERMSERRRFLDWQLAAFRTDSPQGVVTFVGGHQIEQISDAFPHLNFLVNPKWRETGAITSLALALNQIHQADAPEHLFVLYADVLIRPELFEIFRANAENRVLVGIDPDQPTAIMRNKPIELLQLQDGQQAEFIGFLYVPKAMFGAVKAACLQQLTGLGTHHVSALIAQMGQLSEAPVVGLHDVRSFWGHGENSRAVAKFIMSSKATTLARLHKKLKKSTVLPVYAFTFADWSLDRAHVLARIKSYFIKYSRLVVRSSASDEDGFATANPGKFHSELDVENDPSSLSRAIENVLISYGEAQEEDEILIQPYLNEVVISGVLFTRQLDTGAPYYVINYADGSDTTAITSGQAVRDQTVFVSRNADLELLSDLPADMVRLIRAAVEIEQVVLYDALDIEFAILPDGTIVTLQCRPLMLRDFQSYRLWDDMVFDAQRSLQARLADQSKPQEVLGKTPVWSVMADWNPAEIIGTCATPLALELYRYVITDHTWAVQRRQAGYRDVTQAPLVSSLAGNAYVNVRCSLNSFVPAALSDTIATKLIDAAQDHLRSRPELHDKIEFEIIPTCVDFSFDRWSHRFIQQGVLSREETAQLELSLRDITRSIISSTEQTFKTAQSLETEYDDVLCRSVGRGPDGIRALLDTCRTQGALVFAHLARAGFVAVSLLKTAVEKGILVEARYQALLASIETVSTLLRREAFAVKEGRLSKAAFVRRFGHIRPGTYDISTRAYGGAYEIYLAPLVDAATPLSEPSFAFTQDEDKAMTQALQNIGLPMSTDAFLAFVHSAVAGREFSKFVFTKLVSGALEMIREDQLALGVAEQDLDFVALDAILNRPQNHWGQKFALNEMQALIKRRRALHQVAMRVLLPPVVTKPGQILGFVQPEVVANFVTENRAEQELVTLTSGVLDSLPDLKNKIVAIPNADPGYDFLFGMGIKGLITAFGGPNSHMAIRAAEFQLPAAIGVGIEFFSTLRNGKWVVLDCARKTLRQLDEGGL